MKKTLYIIGMISLLWGCSGSVNTSLLSPEEHFNYAYKLYKEGDYQEALTELQSILLQYPGSTINDDAQYYLGMTYYKREQYLLAAYEFSKLIRDIPASEFVSEAQFKLADSYYQLSPPYQLDQSYTNKAITEFQAFIDYFPLSPKVEEAEQKINEMNNKLAEKLYHNAVIYEKMEYNIAAIRYFGEVENTYHDTEYGPMALYRKIQLELQVDKTNDAQKDMAAFLARYPDNERASDVKDLQEQLLSKK